MRVYLVVELWNWLLEDEDGDLIEDYGDFVYCCGFVLWNGGVYGG